MGVAERDRGSAGSRSEGTHWWCVRLRGPVGQQGKGAVGRTHAWCGRRVGWQEAGCLSVAEQGAWKFMGWRSRRTRWQWLWVKGWRPWLCRGGVPWHLAADGKGNILRPWRLPGTGFGWRCPAAAVLQSTGTIGASGKGYTVGLRALIAGLVVWSPLSATLPARGSRAWPLTPALSTGHGGCVLRGQLAAAGGAVQAVHGAGTWRAHVGRGGGQPVPPGHG